jgi:ribosomal protein S6--L-glutamate ligase
MNIGILYLSRSDKVTTPIATLAKAVKRKKHTPVILNIQKLSFLREPGKKIKIYYRGKRLSKKDLDIIITRPNFSNKPDIYSYATTLFQKAGIEVINAWPAYRIINKLAEHVESIDAKIPMPRWGIAKDKQEILFLAKKIGFPVVMKIPMGNQGTGVFFANKQSDLKPISDYLSNENNASPVIVEEFIAEAKGSDIRIFVVGGKIAGAMKRVAPKGDIRANTSNGGKAKRVTLTEEEKALACKAADVYGLEIGGIDILRSARGPLVIEVNSNPGFKALNTVVEKDVPSTLIDYAIKKARENKKK